MSQSPSPDPSGRSPEQHAPPPPGPLTGDGVPPAGGPPAAPPYAASPYAAPPSPPPPVRPARPSRDQVLAVAVALLIGFASVFSAVVAWRASLASIESSRLQSLVVQEQARQQQLERQFEGSVAQDERMAVTYQEHLLAARELQAQADAVRQSNPEMADALDMEAHGRSALARTLLPYISSAAWLQVLEGGTLAYDREAALTFFRELSAELRELRPQKTADLAAQADTRTISLIAVAAVLVAALFFLTVAQVVRTRIRIRQGFAVLGALFIAAGSVAFVLVEVLA